MGGRGRGGKRAAAALLAVVFVMFPILAHGAPLPIVSELTASHVLVPGTGVYFAPAPGLSLSKQFDGFSSATRRIEVFVANIEEPYAAISDTFTDAILKTRSVDVKSRGTLRSNGAEGVLIKALHIDGADKWGKWILLLDGGGHTLVVNGVFASGDDAAARDVEMMLKSAVIRRVEPASNDMETLD